MERDAIVLAGGEGRRLGGVDKAALEVGGSSLLDRVLVASGAAGHTVVVGAHRPTVRPVAWTRESPPGGGPLAGLVAGLAELERLAPRRTCPVMVLAADLPRITGADLERLVSTLTGEAEAEAAVFRDDGGQVQPLAGLYWRVPLIRALKSEGSGTGRPMRILLDRLRIVTVADLGAATDCDTPDQLARHRSAVTPGPGLDLHAGPVNGVTTDGSA